MQESNNYTDFKILILKITLAIVISLSTFSGFAQQNSGIELLRNGPMSQWKWVATNNHEDPIVFELEKRLNDCDGVETVTIIKKTIYSSSKSDRGNTYIDDYGFNCSVSSKGDREYTKEYTILSRKFKEKKSNTSSSNTQTNSSSSSGVPSCSGCTPDQIRQMQIAAQSSQNNSSDSYDYSSNESSYSSNSSNSNSDYSSNSTSESIYQKRQREDAEAKARQSRARQDAQRRADAQVASNQRKVDQMNATSDNIMNEINKIADQRNAQIRAESEAKDAEYARRKEEKERESAERNERLRLDRLEYIRLQAEREEKERISNAQSSFLDNLYDKKIPVVVDSKEVFFLIISRNNDEKQIYISPFSLFANGENELPYKIDVIKDFKSKVSKPYVYAQGPYNSLEEQKNAVANFQSKARNNYVSYSLLKFTYKPKFESSSNKNGDFWGEKKTNSTEPKKNVETEDFWGEKKTSQKPKPKKSIWD
ncbi:putative serine-rich protein [Psychroflexus torquis ATCC 700755]|uniref:Serine-rich protein n=1 Tax=Psychroflexus torquis (strain ATCC 700755 / CIP 106069 / ACAM 623) TaxID=313595 RepID=K4IBY2_PSYTT|nr:hypothetical protein [Psychroflexus torquis]AFU68112.1 putative serine-rich protein [Psychroflexus torquis ATCC 700755]